MSSDTRLVALDEKATKRPSPLIPGGKPLSWLGLVAGPAVLAVLTSSDVTSVELARVHLVEIAFWSGGDTRSRALELYAATRPSRFTAGASLRPSALKPRAV